jgi:hypothetical protein
MKLLPIFAAVVALNFSIEAGADEITGAIEEAVSAYKDGQLSEAVSQLDYAAALIRQQRSKALVAVFPKPMKGWAADEAEGDSVGGAMMGGGISASRGYTRGESEVRIELVSDSPILQSMMGMLNNPALITMNGGKLIKIQGHKAILNNEQKNQPEITLIVDGKAMFTLTGYDVSVDELKAYGEALNLNVL